MRLRWSETAGNQLQEIHEYLAAAGSARPEQVIAGIFDAAEQLILHPRLGHPGRREGTRELTHRLYLIVYEVVGEVVNIASVFLGSRHREA